MVATAFLTFAFFVGLLSFFNPCGTAVMISYLVGFFSRKEIKKNPSKRILSGIRGGILATFGFLTVFVFLGAILTFFGRELAVYIPFFVAILGVFLILVGISILARKSFFFNIHVRGSFDLNKPDGFYKYGMVYSLASFACNLPLFLTVVFGAISMGTFYDGILSFITYGVAAGIAMTAVMLTIATSKELVIRFLHRILPYMNTINALVLILVGIYLIAFQFYYGNIVFA